METYSYTGRWVIPGRTPEDGLVQMPRRIEIDGVRRQTKYLTREALDAAGYNEAVSLDREPYTTYTTQWTKGDDLIYREEAVTATVDETAKVEALATAARAKRDALLTATDWTQLADCPLDADAVTAWATYRQALRDVPQQAGFPVTVEWPAVQDAA